jgi:hypothetical protein
MRETKTLRSVIKSAISESLDEGVTTSRLVSEKVLLRYPELIRGLMAELAVKYVRRETSCQMKKLTVGGGSVKGVRLFGDLKGLPAALSFEESGALLFVKRSRARRIHFHAHIRFLRRLIEADQARHQMVVLANDRLEVLRSRHGDLTEEELIAREFGE